jgi:3-oxoadipate enol-lactonase
MSARPVSLAHRLDGPADAPVVILANSVGTTSAMWDDQLEALAAHRRVLRFDHRGHGDSPVPPGPYAIDDLGHDLVGLLDDLGIEKAGFCGVSLGGMVGMWLASHAPERVERLVLCSTSARLGPAEMWDQRAATVRDEGMDAIVEASLGRWLTEGFRAAHPAVAGRLAGMLRSIDPEGYAGCCEAIRDLDLRGDLGAIGAPTLLIAGAQDPSTPPPHLEAIRDAVAGAHLVVLDDAAHLLNVEHPGAVTRAILGHLGAEPRR